MFSRTLWEPPGPKAGHARRRRPDDRAKKFSLGVVQKCVRCEGLEKSFRVWSIVSLDVVCDHRRKFVPASLERKSRLRVRTIIVGQKRNGKNSNAPDKNCQRGIVALVTLNRRK